MKILLFTLHIVIWNYDTGDKLWDYKATIEAWSLKECYARGVDYITPIVTGIRTYIPNASANVDCRFGGTQ